MTSVPDMLEPPAVTIITGAAGWFGTGFVEALCGEGEWSRAGELRVLVQSDADARRLAAFTTTSPTADTAATVVAIVGDITTPGDLTALFDVPDDVAVDVIHAAGVIHPATVSLFDEVNAVGTQRVVEASLARSVRRFVHVSSNSPFGVNAGPADEFGADEPYRPYLEYGRSKMNAELAVFEGIEGGLNGVIVRPPWFYGPHQPERQTTFFRMVRAGRFPIFGDGRQRRSMTYIDNLIQGVCRAELVDTTPGKAWWIADEHSYELGQIVETVASALTRAGYEVVPPRVRVPSRLGDIAERIDRALQRRGIYQQQLHVLGEMNKTIACSVEAATAELGYRPTVTLEEGMYRSIRWCQANGQTL